MYRFQTCIITVGGAMAVLHTGQEGQGSENDVKSGSEGLQNMIVYKGKVQKKSKKN